jgi:hypothetical protein
MSVFVLKVLGLYGNVLEVIDLAVCMPLLQRWVESIIF